MKNRIVYFDWLRVLACLMVVLMHSPMSTDSENGILLSSISYFTSPCIGIFFMISGALLLPSDKSPSIFLKHRVGKLAIPLVIWSVIYLVVKGMLGLQDVSLFNFLSIPFSPEGCEVFWFIYVLIGLYLIVPIVSPFLKSVEWKEVRIYTLLIVLFFCYPIIGLVLNVNSGDGSFIYYFAGYGGYFYMGWLMRRFPGKFSLKWLGAGYVISWISVVLCRICEWDIDFYSMFWYKSVFVLIMAMFWVKLFQRLFDKHTAEKKWIVTNSNLSFGIYLVHFGLIRYFLWDTTWFQNMEPYWLQTIMIFVSGFLISWTMCYLISRLHLAKYLIGYKDPI